MLELGLDLVGIRQLELRFQHDHLEQRLFLRLLEYRHQTPSHPFVTKSRTKGSQ
jgi:hypothetical protein